MQPVNQMSYPLQPKQEDEIDLKHVFFLLKRRWYWLLICTLLGTAAACLYSQYKQPGYQVDTCIVVPKTNQQVNLQNLFEKTLPGAGDVSINNEIELLKSYTLNHRVFENLNWRTACYQKDHLAWIGLYTREPFVVKESVKGVNAEGIDIEVTPLINNMYQISASGKGVINNEKVPVNFSAIGTFNKPFENKFFHFTLHLREDFKKIAGNKYLFIFRNTNDLTFQYLEKLNIQLTNTNSEVIRLSIEDTEPLREVHYLNELVRIYLDLKLKQQTETKKRSLGFIDNQLSGISDSMNTAGTTVTDFRSKNQIIDLSAQGELVMTQLNDIEKQRSQNQMKLDYFRNLLSYQGKAEGIKQLVTPSVVGIQDPSLNALVLKLGELYSRREVLSFSAHENNPTLVLLNNEIAQVNGQLHENLVNLIDNAQLTIKSLERRYQNISRQLNNLPGKEQQLIDIRRKYELTSEIYTYLLQKRAEIEIALASAIVDVQIIDPARMERVTPTGTSKTVLLILGAIFGLAIPVFFILLSDVLNDKINLQDEVERLTPLTIIGNVLHSHHKSELVVIEKPSSPISESYRIIRTNLQYKFTQGGQQIIGIHSITPGEGKTFTSVNLGCILAMNGKKTLIIGADMRKPRLHKVFKLSNQTGLSNFLIGQSSIKEITQASLIDNLWIIPSGQVPPNPAELLEHHRFSELLEHAKKQFDYIIIDNAPVSMVTDGLITNRHSDLNIFILRYGVSKKGQLKFINSITQKGIIKNPALIINDIKLHSYAYAYSYK